MRISQISTVLAAIVACSLASGCGGGSSSGTSTPATGVEVRMIDAPATFQHVYVTISSVSAVDAAGGVTTINNSPQTFDLLTLQTADRVIGSAGLPAGQYSQVRLTVTSASVVDDTGATFNLKVPSGAQTGIKLVDNFTVNPNQLTSITLDFNAAQSIVRTGNSHAAGGVQYLLKPVIQVVASVVSGQITGVVLDGATGKPIPDTSNPVVTAYPAGAPTDGSVPASAASVVNPTDGTYTLTKLLVGSYDLYFTADGHTTKVITGVNVTADTTTTVPTVNL